MVFFIVYFNTLSGVRALDPKLVQMAQIAGASERHVARHIVFPAAVPHIFAGFRIAVPYAIGGAIIAELISSNRGLGYLVQTGAMNFDTTSVFAAILMATLHRPRRQLDGERLRAGAAALAAADRRHGRRRRLTMSGRARCSRSRASASAFRRGPAASRRPG